MNERPPDMQMLWRFFVDMEDKAASIEALVAFWLTQDNATDVVEVLLHLQGLAEEIRKHAGSAKLQSDRMTVRLSHLTLAAPVAGKKTA